MRIVGGKFRHRNIQMTNLETTRETQDRVRESIYNMIGPYFDGGTCLDLFAGSGAMALEAYSRGMERIVMNDVSDAALNVCKANCKALGILSASFYCLDYEKYLENCNESFDLIILDPPYRMNDISNILSMVEPFLKIDGILVFEMGIESDYPSQLNQLTLIKDRTYGIKRVVIYRRNE